MLLLNMKNYFIYNLIFPDQFVNVFIIYDYDFILVGFIFPWFKYTQGFHVAFITIVDYYVLFQHHLCLLFYENGPVCKTSKVVSRPLDSTYYSPSLHQFSNLRRQVHRPNLGWRQWTQWNPYQEWKRDEEKGTLRPFYCLGRRLEEPSQSTDSQTFDFVSLWRGAQSQWPLSLFIVHTVFNLLFSSINFLRTYISKVFCE